MEGNVHLWWILFLIDLPMTDLYALHAAVHKGTALLFYFLTVRCIKALHSWSIYYGTKYTLDHPGHRNGN
jgi:hypothetical protein